MPQIIIRRALIACVFLSVVFIIFTPNAQAQLCDSGTSVRQCILDLRGKPGVSGLPVLSANTLLDRIVTFILTIAVSLATLAMVIGGIMYILSFGDESKTARAKKVLLYAALGILVTGLAGIIVLTVNNIFS